MNQNISSVGVLNIQAEINRLASILLAKDEMLVVAESCTGGELLAALSSPPGASRWLWGGWVVYSNHAKQMLGVSPEQIAQKGAVSLEVVESLCIQAIRHSRAKLAIAISGIAGPEGATPINQVGVVWLAVYYHNRTQARRLQLSGDRSQIRTSACAHALSFVLELLEKDDE